VTIWLPGLLVLVAGAVAGWWLVRRGAGKGGGEKAAQLADQKLRLQDLTQKKADLLARLQSGVEDLDSGERQRIEIEAARVLRELDQLEKGAGGRPATVASRSPTASSEESLPDARGNWLRRNPLLTGFLFGGGLVGLAALLIFMAARDPGRNQGGAAPMMGGGAPPPSMTPGGQGGQVGAPASPQAAGDQTQGHPTTGQAPSTPEIDQLTREVEANPTDLNLRRQLSITYLANNQLVEAFQQAQFVLQAAPKDPDGHMVVGVVRMAMGNLDEAAQNLEMTLAERPDDPVAHLYRGLVWAQSGETTKAIEVWERGLKAAGGSFPQIEQLIADARQAVASGSTGSIQRNAETATPPTQEQAAQANPSMSGTGAAGVMSGMGGGSAATGAGFPIRIELAPGVSSPEGAVLFVSLRSGPAGPPLAVRRIEGASFPLDLEITGADVMMGGAQLPGQGHLSVRLDHDGNATTREADEPMGTAEVIAGKPATLVLAVQR